MKSKEIREMLKELRIPMNIQLFAGEDGGNDGDGAGDDAGNDDGEGDNNGDDGTDDKPKDMSFDDFLATGQNQAEFDRRMKKALDKAVSKARKAWEAQADESTSEAERLAKMNEAEKAQYKATKKEKELADREAKLLHRELIAEAKSMLSDKGLDPSLAETIVHAGMDAEAVEGVVKTLEESFRQSNEAAVKNALKGGKPPKKTEAGNPADDEAKKIRDAVFKGFF